MNVINLMGAKCGAKTRAGSPCRLPAGHGTQHVGVGRCARHGGKSPRAERAGMIRVAHERALVMGVPASIDPHEAILKCIAISHGEVVYASERIAELRPDDAYGPVITTRPLKYEKGAESSTERVYEEGPPALNIWIEVRRRATRDLVDFAKVAVACGIAERQIKIAEQQASLLATAVRGILTDLGVQDHPEAPDIVRRHLTLLSGVNAA